MLLAGLKVALDGSMLAAHCWLGTTSAAPRSGQTCQLLGNAACRTACLACAAAG